MIKLIAYVLWLSAADHWITISTIHAAKGESKTAINADL